MFKKTKKLLIVGLASLVLVCSVVAAKLLSIRQGVGERRQDAKSPEVKKSLESAASENCLKQEEKNEAVFVGCNGIF